MKTTTFQEMAIQGPAILEDIQAGDVLTIQHNGRAIAVLLPVLTTGTPRPLGEYAGQISISDDFDAPLPDWESALATPLE